MSERSVQVRIAGALGLDPGLLRRVLPLGCAHACVLASLYVLKPARNALFLEAQGAARLPYVLILLAIVGAAVALVHSRLPDSVRAKRTILFGYPFLAIILVGFWLITGKTGAWLSYAFYIWVNLYGLTATSLMWLLANAAFDAREARRVFGLIGAFGIAGAVGGGALTQRLVPIVGTENLMLVCVGLLAVCVALTRAVSELDQPPVSRWQQEHQPQGVGDALQRSSLLRSLAWCVGLAAVVSSVIDVQFNEVVERTFDTKDAKTAFFGEFFAYLNVAAFLLQLFGTGRILRGFGLGVALMVLPVVLALGSGAMLLLPGLTAVVLLKAGDVGLRHSVNKSAIEVSFVPVPAAVKQRAKVFLDTTADNLGTGIGALAVLALTTLAGVPYQGLSVLALVAILAWATSALRARNAYVEEFRSALERHEIDPSDVRVRIEDASSVDSLVSVLDGDNERQTTYALDMLATAPEPVDPGPIVRLLGHGSAGVRMRAVRALNAHGRAELLGRVRDLLDDESPEVRVEAMRFVCTHADREPREQLEHHMRTGTIRTRSAALGCVAEHYSDAAAEVLTEDLIHSVLGEVGPDGTYMRVELAKTFGVLNEPEFKPYLLELIIDPAPSVVLAAIDAAGAVREPELVPLLLSLLEDRRYRKAARTALARHGADVFEPLWERLGRPALTPIERTHLPRVLSHIPDQRTVDSIAERVASAPPSLRTGLLKALNKLRDSGAELDFHRPELDTVLLSEVRWFHALAQIEVAYRDADKPGDALLRRAVAEKRRDALDRVFRILALRYPQRDIYNAYLGVTSNLKVLRASAVEFLDHVLDREPKRYVMPLVESESDVALARTGFELFGERVPDRSAALDRVLRCEDPWLKACALFSVSDAIPDEVLPLVTSARDDADPIVRETALRALNRGGP